MKETAANFKARSTVKATDRIHRRVINFNIGRYNAVVPKGKEQFADLSTARERAKNLKWRAIESLDTQLENFEAMITRRGARVVWANDASEALDEIGRICAEKTVKRW